MNCYFCIRVTNLRRKNTGHIHMSFQLAWLGWKPQYVVNEFEYNLHCTWILEFIQKKKYRANDIELFRRKISVLTGSSEASEWMIKYICGSALVLNIRWYFFAKQLSSRLCVINDCCNNCAMPHYSRCILIRMDSEYIIIQTILFVNISNISYKDYALFARYFLWVTSNVSELLFPCGKCQID